MKRRIQNVNVLIWCYFIIVETLAIVFDSLSSIFDIIFGAHTVIASIILVVLNITVVRSMSNQTLNIKRTVGRENVVVIQNAFNREKLVTQTSIIMVAVFEICTWPFIIISCVTYGMRKVAEIFDIEILLWVYFMCNTLVSVNSIVNPFLHAWCLPKYQKTFQYLFIQLRKRLCVSHTQHHTNKSPQFSTTDGNQNTPNSTNKHSLPNHENTIESPATKQAVGISAISSDVREHFYRKDDHSTENTWL